MPSRNVVPVDHGFHQQGTWAQGGDSGAAIMGLEGLHGKVYIKGGEVKAVWEIELER